MMVLNIGIAPRREVSHKQFFPNKTSPGHFPDFWSNMPMNRSIWRMNTSMQGMQCVADGTWYTQTHTTI